MRDYLSEDEDAEATKRTVEAEGRCCLTIAGDVANPQFCKAVVAETIKGLRQAGRAAAFTYRNRIDIGRSASHEIVQPGSSPRDGGDQSRPSLSADRTCITWCRGVWHHDLATAL